MFDTIAGPTLHTLLVLSFPPLLIGVINRTKAFFAGRTGQPLLQPYYDLAKLFRKGIVQSTTTSGLFRAGPVITFAATWLATFLVPLGSHPAPIAFTGDLILLAYLLALGRFFTVTAALDTGSAFEGMGGAREVTYACLSEPALLFGFVVLANGSGSLSLTTMLGSSLATEWSRIGASLVLVLAATFIVLLAESCRVPFDDPNTHLELTMIHEVMVLDHSGPLLGVILYGAAMKLFILGAVIVRIAIPGTTGDPWLDWALFLPGMIGLAILIGVVESVMARLRLLQIPRLLVGACMLSSFGIILLAR